MMIYSGTVKLTTHLGHISCCKTASDTNRSNEWTYRVVHVEYSQEMKLRSGEARAAGIPAVNSSHRVY